MRWPRPELPGALVYVALPKFHGQVPTFCMTRGVVPSRGFTSPGGGRSSPCDDRVTRGRACLAFGWVCSVTGWQAPNKTPVCVCVCVCTCEASLCLSEIRPMVGLKGKPNYPFLRGGTGGSFSRAHQNWGLRLED